MKRIVLTLCVLIALVTAILLPAYSAELYMWVDEKGVKHITDQPPEKPTKMIGKDTYKRDSPEEIQRYQAEQNAKEQNREAETRQRQQTNRAQEEAQKQNDRQQAQQAQQSQQQRKTQSEIQDLRNREADKIEAAAQRLSPGRKAEALTNAARIRLGQEPVSHTPERTVNTPPPVNNSPKWGTVYDQKTRRNVEGWTQP